MRVLRSVIDGNSWLPTVVCLPSVNRVDFFNIHYHNLPTVQATIKSGGQPIHTAEFNFVNGLYMGRSLLVPIL
jgi:hypothetical protein